MVINKASYDDAGHLVFHYIETGRSSSFWEFAHADGLYLVNDDERDVIGGAKGGNNGASQFIWYWVTQYRLNQ